MAKNLTTGLVIGQRALAWASIEGAGAATSGRAELTPAGAEGSDEAKARAAALRAACAAVAGEVTVAVPSESVLLRVVDLPAGDGAEIRGMVELQVDKFSPFPVETLVMAHEVLARRGETLTVLIAAVKLAVVEALGAELGAAGLRPRRVDVETLGWWHSLRAGGAVPAAGRAVFVLMPEKTPEILVAEDGVLVLFRSLGDTGDLAGPALAEEIGREVAYTLTAFELERSGAKECSLAVCVRDAKDAEPIVSRLQAEHGGEVRVVRLDGMASAAEGVARRSVEGAGVDLTPAAWHSAARGREFKKQMIVAGAGVAALWILVMGSLFGGLAWQGYKVQRLNREQARWRDPAMEVRATRRRVAMIRRYMDRRHSALECLREVSRLLPAGIDLTSFTYRKGESVKADGRAATVEQVYEFKRNLDGCEMFPETRLSGPTTDRKSGQQVFSVDMQVPPEETAAGGGDA
jgi:hypothetical protein